MLKPEIQKGKNASALVIILGIAIILTILVLAMLPRIAVSVRESGMIDLVRDHLAGANTNILQTPLATVYTAFPIPEETTGWKFALFPAKESEPQTGHKTLERLFVGPDATALAQGAVTFIPEGTRLIGLTITRATAYVDVSGNILQETIWSSIAPEGALKQLEATLLSMEGVKHCVILVEGTPIRSFP